MLEMTYAETLVLGVASVFVQSYWHSSKRLKPIQVIFNLSQLTVATAAAYCVFQFLSSHSLRDSGRWRWPAPPLSISCSIRARWRR